ncbi:putative Cytochrome c biogenesis ATP-binding export protein CcmA [Candidatus Xenohaliotis californiensis]|uniref:Cytochrome c biogenesis ATP-binding export protein CcmA n=1 Tax=Candidatus Xenohaliotis californiensis TaxID=84677 RepID=A0ABP0EVM1_9RICK|nr:putative Cytochrome c biogenesis ATP-binding export protein CcmA [Candidatus Xenohaliotis californiensis]
MLTLDKFSCTKANSNPLSLSIYACSTIQVKSLSKNNASKFLHTIAGLSKPELGKIIWEKTKNASKNTLYIKNLSGLYNTMTVMEHLYYWAKIYNTSEAISSAIKYFSLKDILHYKPKELDNSQHKQILLSKTLIHPMDIWILDAPFANLNKESCTAISMLINIKCSNGGLIFIANTNSLQHKWNLQINLDNGEILTSNL